MSPMPAASRLRRTGFLATLLTGIALVAASLHGLADVARGLEIASARPQPGLVAGPSDTSVPVSSELARPAAAAPAGCPRVAQEPDASRL